MLKITKNENLYEIRVETSNKLIGHFIPSDDGFYYFADNGCQNGGLWSDYVLIEIGNKLKEINEPWMEQLKKVL